MPACRHSVTAVQTCADAVHAILSHMLASAGGLVKVFPGLSSETMTVILQDPAIHGLTG